MFIRWILVSFGLLGLLAGLAGCAWMPANGPSGDAVVAGRQDPTSIPYALVKVTPEAEQVLAYNAPLGSAGCSERYQAAEGYNLWCERHP